MLHPSSIDYFWFIVNVDIPLNTFDFVTVDNVRRTRTIGIVQDMMAEDANDVSGNDPSNRKVLKT
jgi:hypothetical protein